MVEHQQTFPGGDEIIQGQLKMFKALWKKLVLFVGWITSTKRKWIICVEWPKNCAYWNWKEVRSFLPRWNVQEVCFDGCAIGLKARSGEFLKHPWRVYTNDQHILVALRGITCSNTGNVLTDHVHAEFRGVDCKESEKYTFSCTRRVHNVLSKTIIDDSKKPVPNCTSSCSNACDLFS